MVGKLAADAFCEEKSSSGRATPPIATVRTNSRRVGIIRLVQVSETVEKAQKHFISSWIVIQLGL